MTAVDALRQRDEILQVMFWMAGQGFGTRLGREEVARFVQAPEAELSTRLAELSELGLLEEGCGEGRYQLTERGQNDARHRFVDEFDEIIAPEGKGHGQCGPYCEEHLPMRASQASPAGHEAKAAEGT